MWSKAALDLNAYLLTFWHSVPISGKASGNHTESIQHAVSRYEKPARTLKVNEAHPRESQDRAFHCNANMKCSLQAAFESKLLLRSFNGRISPAVRCLFI